MIKDPTDVSAVTFRVQCYIDTGDYQKAKETCLLLAKEIKEPFFEKIKAAQKGEASS
jgi:hypothetical protein